MTRVEKRGRTTPGRKTGAAFSTGVMGTAMIVGGSAAFASPSGSITTTTATTAPSGTTTTTALADTTTTTATTATMAPSSTTTTSLAGTTTTTTSTPPQAEGVGVRARANTGTGKTITVSVTPKTIVANGTDQATVTAVVSSPCGQNTSTTCYDPTEQPGLGGSMVFTSSDPNEKISAVTYPQPGNSSDPATGTYTATITASKTAEVATITATGTSTAGVVPEGTGSPSVTAAQAGSVVVTGTTTLTQVAGPAQKVVLAMSPSTIVANGKSTSTATATVTDAFGNLVSFDHVSFTSSDNGETVGPVTDHPNGTYTAVVTSSTKAQTDVITATDTSVSPNILAKADLVQVAGPAAHLTLVVSPPSIPANGNATSTATATVTDAFGNPVSADNVTITSSDPHEKISAVTARSGGVYTATVTASSTAETATITATDSSVTPALTATAPLTQTAVALASPLAFTGARAGEEAGLAAGLAGLGIALVAAARRRRRRFAHSIRR